MAIMLHSFVIILAQHNLCRQQGKVTRTTTMPKVKKIRASALTSQSVRHEPLGQTIQDDLNKVQYASQRVNNNSNSKSKSKSKSNTKDEELLLDEKTSGRILKLSQEQQQEIEREEQWQQQQQRKNKQQAKSGILHDSDEEEEEDEEGMTPYGIDEEDDE
jgi:hypothetical protein